MNIKKLLTLLALGFIITSNAQAQNLQFCLQSKKGDKFLKEKRTTQSRNGRSYIKKEIFINAVQPISQMTKFTLEPVRDESGYYFLKRTRVVDGKKYFTYLACHYSGAKKTKLNLFSKVGNIEHYKWKFEAIGDGSYNIKSKLGNYLDVQWGNTTNGTPIWMWPKNGDDAQVWRIIPIRNGRFAGRSALWTVDPSDSRSAQFRNGNSGANSNANRNTGNNRPNRTSTNRVIINPKVKVTIINIKATHGDDGGSDRTFEFYTKTRIEKGHRWRASSIDAYHYPKYSSNFLRANPSGSTNSLLPFVYTKSLYGVDRENGYFKVHLSLWDYDEASSDDCFDISPKRGANELPLVIVQSTGKIYFKESSGNWIAVGKKGIPFTIEGTDYNNADELTAKMTLKIDWR
jgi:hypothetical protein